MSTLTGVQRPSQACIRHQTPINHLQKTALDPDKSMENILKNSMMASNNHRKFNNLLQVRKPTQNGQNFTVLEKYTVPN